MTESNLSVSIDFDALRLCDTLICTPFQPEVVTDLLGVRPRVFTGLPPAPTGHRNNWRHIFDQLGIVLTDQHDTQVVHEVKVSLKTRGLPRDYEPRMIFSGDLCVCGVQVTPDTSASKVISASGREFEQRLPGIWSFREGSIHIALTVYSRPSLVFRERNAPIESVSIDFGA